jgi:hypothetical protein
MSNLEGLVSTCEKVYTVGKMRCYVIAAGTLFSVVSAFGQQNVVPNGVLDGAIHRALNFVPHTYPLPVITGQKPVWFSVPATRENVCAIPLLEAPIKPTHDRIAHAGLAPQIDPKMARPVGAPPCPKR